MIDEMPQSTQRRPAMTEHQEIRKYTGEGLRVAIPWHQHPAWTIHAQRVAEYDEHRKALLAKGIKARPRGFRTIHALNVGRFVEEAPIAPPPVFTDADIRAMVVGDRSGRAHTCPNCGHVMVETR